MGERTALKNARTGRRIIERPRLTRLLTESESRVMLLVAPAGYGKTTLAREWLAGGGRKHVWYQVTAASTDVAALALGLANTAASLIAGASERLRTRLKAAVDPAVEPRAIAADLAGELADWPTDVRIVIDDYHLLSESAAAESFMDVFVSTAPASFLIASRKRPVWITAKKLLYGEVSEFGRTALAMTHDEAAEALSRSHDEMPGLVSLAEGWPAVIGLAALLPSPMRHSEEEVPETLHEYFAEELYQGLDADLRWNLTQLALAPSVQESVAKAVFGSAAPRVLQSGYRSGFLTKGPRGHEMHPLLRHFLRTKLADFAKDDVVAAAQSFGHAFADAGLWDDAATLASDFNLEDVILRVLLIGLEPSVAEGRIATVKRWIETARLLAPTAAIVRLAEVEVAFRTGNVASAREKARQLVQATRNGDALAGRIYLRAGQISHLDDRLEEAVRLFTAAEAQADTPSDLRRAVWSRFVSLTDLDDRDGAAEALATLERLPPVGVDDLLRANQARLQLALRWGGLTQALAGVTEALELLKRSGDPFVKTGFLQTYGVALILAARYAEASDIARREIEEAKRFKLDWVLPHALELSASAAMGQRKFQASLKTLDRVRRLAEGNAHTELNVDVLKARVHLCRGAPDRAVALLEGRGADATSPGMQGDFLATFGLALACCQRLTDAEAQLDASAAVTTHLEARTLGAFGKAIILHFSGSDSATASATLSSACQVATETGNFDAFVTAYRACPALVPQLQHVGAGAAPFLQLVRELDSALAETLGISQPAKGRRSEGTLTRREREILELVHQGLSNRQIARTLWIAESTVKVHIRHVFEKLGVQSRTEAAAVAEDVL